MVRFFTAQLILFIYFFLAISLVQNIFLVIVEDAYFNVKNAKSTDWLLKGESPADKENQNAEKSS